MSRAATLSVLGLYEWDNTLFDLLSIPEELSKDTLVQNLLAELAELEVIYPNPIVMKNLIGVWSAKQLDIWERLYATTQYEYNPIENYDRQESGTDGGTNNTTHTGTDGRTEAITNGGTDTRAETIQDSGTEGVSTSSSVSKTGQDSVTGTDTKGHWKAGFDSVASGDDDGLVKETRDQDDGTTTTQYGNTESGSGSSTTTFGKTQGIQESSTYGKTQNVTESKTFGSSINETKSGTHTLRAHGNIGTMTVQQMIREQREIENYNIYDIIIDDFRMRFCILVY